MKLLLALVLAFSSPAFAGELAGVTLPDTATVGGQSLVLNGIGLREKYWIDVYVGGLYLPEKCSDGAKIVESDVPKRIVMHFIYNGVSAEKMIETYKEGFAGNPLAATMTAEIEQLYGWLETMNKGDEMVIDYVPGTGTTITIKGKVKGTISNADFRKLIFNNYVGTVANAQLRAGMLGQ